MLEEQLHAVEAKRLEALFYAEAVCVSGGN